MKHITFLLPLAICCCFLQTVNAQSISGNLNAETSKNALGYGNVDIYQGDELVASVLTDRLGNFSVALDTGRYRCVVNYSGYTPVEREIHVQKDERADFSVKEDPTKPKRATAPVVQNGLGAEMKRVESTAFSTGEARYSYGWSVGSGSGGKAVDGVVLTEHVPTKRMVPYEYTTLPHDALFAEGKPNLSGVSGALTAGEVNDFAKWKLWQGLTDNELAVYQPKWNIAPKGRYTVELHTKTGIPVTDALVKLMNGNNVLFSARTDNTGKAELWLSIRNETPDIRGKLYMSVDAPGGAITIRDVQPFEKTINHQVLEITCDQLQTSENVDIAFVVDATGSMGDELSYLQAEMNDIIYQSKQISSKLNFRFANVFYRDMGPNELYATRTMPFSRILSESVDYISQQSAGGGGDVEEAVEVALDSAINGLQWSKEARARILFLILDAPPHNTPEIQQKLQRLIAQAAEKGIRIVPIGASGITKSTEYLMRCLALGTNGTYTFLTDHSGIGNSHIKPSTDRFDVELLNEVMVRILKSYTYMPDCDQELPQLDLPYPDSIVVYPVPADSTDTNAIVVPDPNPPVRDSLTVKWNYWPNPTNGIVNITADVDITELYVTDLSGKVLQIINNIDRDRTVQIDLSAYATGIYLIRYPLGKTWVSGKVVLQR